MIGTTPALAPEDAEAIRYRVIFDHHKYDPQYGDTSVIAPFALVITPALHRELCARAEALASEMFAAERAIASDRGALSELGLPWALRVVLGEGALLGSWSPTLARFVRFDFHPTDEGLRISECNSDVPGGFIEAGALSELMRARHPEHAAHGDPAAALADAVASKLTRLAAPTRAPEVGLVHATAYTDDLQLMLYLRDRLAERGVEGIPCGPDSLEWSAGRARLRGRPLDGLIRNFPGEWLIELLWRGSWWRHFRCAETPVANPGLAMLSQSKRFPIACARLGLALPTWSELLPQTLDPRDPRVDVASGTWVLKPALGRVGEDVAVPGVSGVRALAQVARRARRAPARWVAQRAFRASGIETPLGRMYPCIGVFVIDGRAAGLYGRLGRSPLIDGAALEAAVLVRAQGDARASREDRLQHG